MTLKSRKRLILLSLIIKGVLIYSSALSVFLLIAFSDYLKTDYTLGIAVLIGVFVSFLCRVTSILEFRRILFLSREEGKELREETI